MVFNTEQFEWSDVTIQLGDRVLTAVQGVSYDTSQDKELIYGKGNQPLAIQRGNKTYKGEITVLQSELHLLINSAPNKDLTDYRNLTITVSYSRDDVVVTDGLVGVEFTEMSKSLKQNDKFMTVTLPIIFTRLQLAK